MKGKKTLGELEDESKARRLAGELEDECNARRLAGSWRMRERQEALRGAGG